jgi:hypothetical protein
MNDRSTALLLRRDDNAAAAESVSFENASRGRGSRRISAYAGTAAGVEIPSLLTTSW